MYRNQINQLVYSTINQIKKNTPYKNWSFGHGKYTEHIKSIDHWLNTYSSSRGVYLNNGEPREYPEVTGYWIETLLKWGYTDKAKSWYHWLVKLQHKDGGWPDYELRPTSFFFDSGQIIRGIKTYSDVTGVKASSVINKFLKFFDANYQQNIIPKPGNTNIGWHLINLQVAWIVHRFWPEHVSVPILESKLKPYFDQFEVGELVSHFDIYIMEAMFELNLYPAKFDHYLKYFDRQIKKYGLVPESRANHVPCYTATAQLGVLYYKMGRIRDANTLLFSMLDRLDLKRGNWPGTEHGGTYHVNREISWGLKYFLDMLYYYSTGVFDLDQGSEWERVEGSFYHKLLELVESASLPKSDILEIGAGLGRYLKELKKHGFNTYGVDISQKNCAECSRHKLKVTQSSFTQLNLPKTWPQKFDTIFAIEAFEHAVFPANALKQASSRLKKNGKLVIIDKDIMRCLSYQLCPFENYYTKTELATLAKQAGLQVQSFTRVGDFLSCILVKSNR